MRDVELISYHINKLWKEGKPRIICLWDKATSHYDLGNFEIIPLTNTFPGTWSRIQLYSPEMEQYRPFLYVDLDTAIIRSLENIIKLVEEDQFITLEDFSQKNRLATGLVWFPKNSEKIKKIWESFKGVTGWRMDYFIRTVTQSDLFWQHLTVTIKDYKPLRPKTSYLVNLPSDTDIVCFHGKPRIFDADISWVKDYVQEAFKPISSKKKVTVIIPYKTDRGWLKDAIKSVPEGVQLLVSQGEGNWPANFNKVLDQATGDYIRWLHEDDMLTLDCIEDSVRAIEEQGVDFIHGNAIELSGDVKREYKPPIHVPIISDMLKKNVIHSATLMYKREIFENLKMDETLNTAEEFEFNLRCLKEGYKIGYCDKPLAFYRRHPQQKVRVVSKVEKDKERELVRDMYK